MAAVFTGTGLGLFNSSFTQLGGASGGSGRLGQSNSRYYVNLATGNLVLQDIDETILTRGLPVSMLRTYNSQGTVAGQGQDGWMSAFDRRVGNLSGTVNTAGSTVTRYLGDGSEVVYAWDETRYAYVSSVGDGMHDIITASGANGPWSWQDGNTQHIDTYDATGRLTTIRDAKSGASYSLLYDEHDRLFGVVSDIAMGGAADGDGLFFAYEGDTQRLLGVVSRENGVAKGQVWYGYDAHGRLSSVTTDLRPDASPTDINLTTMRVTLPTAVNDNIWNETSASNNDGLLFRTVYTYQDIPGEESLRIAQVKHSDGSRLSIEYDNDKVSRVVVGDGNGQGHAIEYAYGAVSGDYQSVIVRDQGRVDRNWTYVFNIHTNQLSWIESPQVDGLSDVTSYAYDTQGNVTQVRTTRGAAVVSQTDYAHDSYGNVVREWDLHGNRIDREYVGGDLAIEVRYTGTDPDGASGGLDPDMSTAQVTRYTYDGLGRLTFSVNALGEVTQYLYGNFSSGAGIGLLASTRRFIGATYNVSALSATTRLEHWQLQSWTNGKLAQTERTDYRYDAMGRLQEKREYAQVAQTFGSGLMTGDGVLDASTNITRYTYDAQGLLRQQITQRGTGRALGAGTPEATSEIVDYVYDGMGRLLSSLKRSGATAEMPDPRDMTPANQTAYADWLAANEATTVLTTWTYLDSGNSIKVVSDTGMTRTEVRNAAGMLVAVTEADAPSSPMATRTTERKYDTAGRLVAEQDAGGGRRYFIYDEKGRLSATIDATGAVTQTLYDGADRVVEVRAYANRVTPLSDWWTGTPPTRLWRSDTAGTPLSTDLVVAVDATRDMVTQKTYDAAGRVSAETVVGADASQTRKTTYTYDAADRLLQVSVTDGAGTTATARTTRYLYDKADRRIAQVDLRADEQGYVTEFVYDLAGRVVKTIRYADTTTNPAATTLADLKQSIEADANDQITRMFYDGLGNLVGSLDAEGYLTEFVYDEALNQRAVKAYERKLTGLAGNESLSTLRASATAGYAPETGFRKTQRQFNALGQLETELNHEGTVTRYTYDEAGRLVRTESAFGASEVRTNNLRYDVFGNVIGEIDGEGVRKAMELLTGGLPLDHASLSSATLDAVYAQYGVRHSYDLLGRRIESTDAQGNKTWTFHDSEGRVTFVVRGQRDEANVLNARAEITETRYDALGRVIDTIAYGGALTVPVPGSRASVQSVLTTLVAVGATNSRIELSYDRRGLLTERKVWGDGDARDVTRYGYNAFGELVTQQDMEADTFTARRTMSWTYDARGQSTGMTQSGGGLSRSTSTTYDAFGRA
ncbi:DUF6531 domain-containing protein, partial [Lysobacter brunescens]